MHFEHGSQSELVTKGTNLGWLQAKINVKLGNTLVGMHAKYTSVLRAQQVLDRVLLEGHGKLF